MKRYLLFDGAIYYPFGGWSDFQGEFDTVDEAMQHSLPDEYTWAHVVDTQLKQIVFTRYEDNPWEPETTQEDKSDG